MTAPAVAPPQRVNRFAELNELSRTTPGVLTLLTVALVVVSVLVGIFTAISVQSRATALDDLAERSGPLSVAAQDIYRSLSDADATANSAFLSGGLEPTALRARYESDIAQAESALAVAVAAREPADLAAENSPLATLSSQLSVYTGLVETARANNHQGLPIGAAYQREASNLMRARLLPAAAELYKTETDRVIADQDRAASLPFVEVLLGLVALGVLFYAQRFLRRHTNRVFNVGLLVASGAAVISLVWVIIATIGVMANVDSSRDDGSAQTNVLARARIAILAARADETLTLVARGSGAQFEEHYVKTREELTGDSGLLDTGQALATDDGVRDRVTTAISDLEAWHEVHTKIRDADNGGDYATAVALAVGPEDTGAAVAFDKVDTSLRESIADTTKTFDDEISQARNAVTGTVIGVILLAVVMAAGAVAGIWQRLKEYR